MVEIPFTADRRLAIAGLSWISYFIVIPPLLRGFGQGSMMLTLMPLVVTAWLYGMRPGLMLSVLIPAVNAALMYSMGFPVEQILGLFYLLGAFVMAAVVVMVGRLHDLKAESEARLRINRQLEEKFEKAFNANPSIMAISGLASGKFIDVNRAFQETLGYRKDELVGKTSRELGIFEDNRRRTEILRLVGKKGRARNAEATVVTKSGEKRKGLFSVEVIEVGGQQQILTIMDDVTEREAVLDDLRRRTEELEKFNSLAVDREDKMIALKNEVLMLKAENEKLKNKSK